VRPTSAPTNTVDWGNKLHTENNAGA
jgi:hypothetical protein